MDEEKSGDEGHFDSEKESSDKSHGEEGADEDSDDGNESDSEGRIATYKGKKSKEVTSSDEESDSFYNNDAGEIAAQKERFAALNENALHFLIPQGVDDVMRLLYPVSMSGGLWYSQIKAFKDNLELIFVKRGAEVPFYVEHLDEHKLRVEYSATNEMVFPPAKKYPKTR